MIPQVSIMGRTYKSPVARDSKANDSDGIPGLCGKEGGGIVQGVSLVRPETVNPGL